VREDGPDTTAENHEPAGPVESGPDRLAPAVTWSRAVLGTPGTRPAGGEVPADGESPADRETAADDKTRTGAAPASEESVNALSRRLADYSRHIENLNIAEYVELVRNPRRMFYLHFLSGIGRGFGIAVGFTLLGALMVMLLRRLVMLNLPGIGDFIAEIVRIVQGNLQGP